MLLRVDIARGGPSGPVLGDDGPLHACLSTAPVPSAAETQQQGGGGGGALSSTQASGGSGGASSASGGGGGGALRTGEILTVGRKSSLVVLPDDRAVSRSHASIRLISSDAPGDGGGEDERPATLLGDSPVMEHGRPETEWERAACASSPTGTVCVVRDNGSKFGTFVGADPGMLERHLPAAAPADAARGGRDGDATDDETDDEGGTGGGSVDRFALRDPEGRQSAALDVLYPAGTGDAPTRFVELRKGGITTIPLLQLSHSDPGGPPPSVVLLFGTMGSAVRLTLVPMNYVFSSIRKADLAPIVASLGYVGATHSERWETSRSTHLVTSEKKAAAKGIMAWCCRRPAVTTGYVAALVGRRDARDPLPDPDDHVPPGKDWDRDLTTSGGPCRSLLGYRIACMVDDDSAALSSSAGAEVLSLHDGEVLPSSVRDDAEEVRFWYDRQMARAEEERRVLVLIESSSKSCKALFGALRGVDGIRITNARNLAKAITSNRGEGDLILDSKKVPIQKIVGWDAPGPGTAETAAAAGEADGASGDGGGPAAGGTGAETEGEDKAAVEDDDDDEKEESAPAKRKRGAGDDEPEADDGRADGPEEASAPAEKRQRTRKPAGEIPEETEEGMDFGDGGGDGGRPEEDEEKDEPPKEPEVESSDEDEPGVPAERRDLEVTDDGWMVAAPANHRRAYRREIEPNESVVSDVSADTERVRTLVVREYVPPGARARRASRSGRDFKRFRKNVIIPGYTTSGDQKDSYRDCSDGVVQIELEDSFAKDSERLRQLQMQQEELEREQAAAESLFNDDGRGGATTGRKKKRGAGITAYMTQSTVKRGRGRRG